MPNRLLAGAFLLALATTAHAAIGEAPAECFTIAADLHAIQQSGSTVQATVFHGIEARQLLAALVELKAPGAEIWGMATSALLMVAGPDADPPALIKFADVSGCFFVLLKTDLNGVALIRAHLGPGA